MATYYVTTAGSDSNGGTNDTSDAFATPGKASSVATSAGDIVYIKAGTYTLTTATYSVAGGAVQTPTSARVAYIGYETTAGDGCPTGNRPIINAGSVAPAVVISIRTTGQQQLISNIEVDGNNQNINGIAGQNLYYAYSNCVNCVCRNCDGDAGFVYTSAVGCLSIDNDGHGFSGCRPVYCRAEANTGTGFYGIPNNAMPTHCIAVDNGDRGFFGSYNILLVNCISDGNGAEGFYCDQVNFCVVNSIATGNTSTGYRMGYYGAIIKCADLGNSARASGTRFDTSVITISGSPFVSGTLELSNTADGVLCQASGVGVPGGLQPDLGAMPLGLTTDELADAIWTYSNRTES